VTLAICLLVVAFGLVMAEIAIPSFGLLSLLAGGAYTWALVEAFAEGDETGWSFVGLGIILLPVAIGFGLKILPKTPLGRRLLLQVPNSAGDSSSGDPSEADRFAGRTGVALSDLRPTGIARIEGERVDVVAGGRYIVKGTDLMVSTVQGNRIVVEERQDSTGKQS
jgi:membrane-bound serine protease (ClpP class)